MLRVSVFFFFSSRRRHTRFDCDWSSDVCSSDLYAGGEDDATDREGREEEERRRRPVLPHPDRDSPGRPGRGSRTTDRKSTRLNSSHSQISYAVFCLKKKK